MTNRYVWVEKMLFLHTWWGQGVCPLPGLSVVRGGQWSAPRKRSSLGTLMLAHTPKRLGGRRLHWLPTFINLMGEIPTKTTLKPIMGKPVPKALKQLSHSAQMRASSPGAPASPEVPVPTLWDHRRGQRVKEKARA